MSVSGYYAWAARPDSPTEVWRQELAGAIEEIHAEVKHRYGSPRMTAELNARGHACSENTVAELMREHGIRAKAPRRFVRTTDSNHRLPVAANVLDRDFDPEGPNEQLVCRHHVHSDARGLAVLGGGRGSVQPDDRGVVDGRVDGEPVGR